MKPRHLDNEKKEKPIEQFTNQESVPIVRPIPIRGEFRGKLGSLIIPKNPSLPERSSTPAPDSGKNGAPLIAKSDEKVIQQKGGYLPRQLCEDYILYRRTIGLKENLRRKMVELKKQYQSKKEEFDQKFPGIKNSEELNKSYAKDCHYLALYLESQNDYKKNRNEKIVADLQLKIDNLLAITNEKKQLLDAYYNISHQIKKTKAAIEDLQIDIPDYEGRVIESLKALSNEQKKLRLIERDFPEAITVYETLKVLSHQKGLPSALKEMSPFFKPSTTFTPNERLSTPRSVGALHFNDEDLQDSNFRGLLGSFSPCSQLNSHCFFDRAHHDAQDKVLVSRLRKREDVIASLIPLSIPSIELAFPHTPEFKQHKQMVKERDQQMLKQRNRSQSMFSLPKAAPVKQSGSSAAVLDRRPKRPKTP